MDSDTPRPYVTNTVKSRTGTPKSDLDIGEVFAFRGSYPVTHVGSHTP